MEVDGRFVVETVPFLRAMARDEVPVGVAGCSWTEGEGLKEGEGHCPVETVRRFTFELGRRTRRGEDLRFGGVGAGEPVGVEELGEGEEEDFEEEVEEGSGDLEVARCLSHSMVLRLIQLP